jgi:hypothetical protein
VKGRVRATKSKDEVKAEPSLGLSIGYYITVAFILMAPGIKMLKLTDSNWVQNWGMYHEAKAICTLRFLNAAHPGDLEFNERIEEELRATNHFKGRKKVILSTEEQSRAFTKNYCGLQQKFGPAFFELNCFREGHWVELEKRGLIACR